MATLVPEHFDTSSHGAGEAVVKKRKAGFSRDAADTFTDMCVAEERGQTERDGEAGGGSDGDGEVENGATRPSDSSAAQRVVPT